MKNVRKTLVLWLFVAVLIVPYVFVNTPVAAAFAAEYGDADDNGEVSALDALAVLKHVVKLAILPQQLQGGADVNLDGAIDATDALMILRYVVKLLPSLPVGGTVAVPEDSLQAIKEYVIGKGETDETGIYYIYDTYEIEEGTLIYQIIMEIAYDTEKEKLVFGNTMISFDSATGEYYVELVEMDTDGTNSNSIYLLGSLDEAGEIVSNGVLGTYLVNAQVTEDMTFAYETLYPEGEDLISAGVDIMADTAIHLGLYNWNSFLEKHLDMTLSDIGFTQYFCEPIQ